jgi:hypothetical protein
LHLRPDEKKLFIAEIQKIKYPGKTGNVGQISPTQKPLPQLNESGSVRKNFDVLCNHMKGDRFNLQSGMLF